MNKRERISDFVRSLDSAPHSQGSPRNYYAAFFQLWNAQKYYEAHDVLEQLWLVEENAKLARFYQALIQAAGAFVHLQKNFEHPSHPKHSRRLRPATRVRRIIAALATNVATIASVSRVQRILGSKPGC